MRQISNDFKTRLNSPLNYLCRAWIITPKIGSIIRVSEFDKDIEINGQLFKAMDSFDGGALEIQNSLGADRTSISSALNAQGISREAILLGHFDKAKVESIVFDWQAPQYFVKIWQGHVARTILRDFGFEFELAGPESELNKSIGRQFTRHCSASLGDSNCKININALGSNFVATIEGIVSLSILKIATNANFVIEHFARGEVHFQTGIWSGFKAKISSIENNNGLFIKTKNPLPFAPQLNDTIKVFKGCDKSFECCKTRFQNQENFAGFPFMPGEGVIYASP